MPTATAKRPTDDAYVYTGLPPIPGRCPGVDAQGRIHALPPLKLTATRAEILDYFNNGWTLTEVLFSGLAHDEAYYRRPYHQLRHPMIFYYGHPVSLYVNKLRVAGLLDGPVNAEFEKLFETGVDEMRWDDLHDGEQHIWPSVAAVRDYRQQVYHIIVRLIETHPALADARRPITIDDPMWALAMGFEHERIHLETSSVLIRELPLEYVRVPEAWPSLALGHMARATPPNPLVACAETTVEIGKPRDFPSFGWDNEYGHEARRVRPFSASRNLISNGEFLEFVKDGGYLNEAYWSREGWGWRRFRNVKHPAFWVQTGPAGLHEYRLRTVFEEIAMQADWPALVNFHEAKAYAAWATARDGATMPYRLLTEAEHHALRDGSEIADAVPGNLHLRHGSEISVTHEPANARGFHDVFGNAWQWAEDHFHPLEGGKPHPYYDDFSVPCYDGEHQMILGGSFASTGDEASRFARFHFRPHFFQHAGFRLARNDDGNPASDAKSILTGSVSNYESTAMLDRYLLRYWGSADDLWDPAFAGKVTKPDVPDLAKKQVELTVKFAQQFERAIDIGCAAGRTSFDLTRHFKRVIGIDYSHTLIEAANTLKTNRKLPYFRLDTGARGATLMAELDSDIDCSRVHFEQGDGSAIAAHFRDFDAVLLANVLCRLPDPKAGLERLQGENGLVKRGGIAVMTTPFSWLEEFTPREKWLSGLDSIAAILTEFELVHEEEVPFLFRVHRRRFEYIITQASVWRRKMAA